MVPPNSLHYIYLYCNLTTCSICITIILSLQYTPLLSHPSIFFFFFFFFLLLLLFIFRGEGTFFFICMSPFLRLPQALISPLTPMYLHQSSVVQNHTLFLVLNLSHLTLSQIFYNILNFPHFELLPFLQLAHIHIPPKPLNPIILQNVIILMLNLLPALNSNNLLYPHL